MSLAASAQLYGKQKIEGVQSYWRVAASILQRNNPLQQFFFNISRTFRMMINVPKKIKQLKQTIEYGKCMVHRMERIIDDTNKTYGNYIPGTGFAGSQLNQIR